MGFEPLALTPEPLTLNVLTKLPPLRMISFKPHNLVPPAVDAGHSLKTLHS